MNFGSDHRVRNAFRATLLDEPSSASILATQEIDATDVLEVRDLAHAIARAEEVLRARSSRVLADVASSPAKTKDIFDALLATDDAVGPAVHAPYVPTPLPPRGSPLPTPPGVTRPATLLRPLEELTPIPMAPRLPAPISPAPAPPPAAIPPAPHTAPIPPAPRTAPILVLDDDAFYHPAGRIRTFAEATLDGYRPEPTLLVRLRTRRSLLAWVVLLVLAPVVLLALVAAAMPLTRGAPAPASTAPVGTTTILPAVVAPPPPAATVAEPGPALTAEPSSDVPVIDVNSLKSVPTRKSAPARKPRR